MLKARLVKFIRTEVIDKLVASYCKSFSETELSNITDNDYKNAVQFWRNCDEAQRKNIRYLMRFSSQNSISSMLALIDNSSFCYETKNEIGLQDFVLTTRSIDGEIILSEDLVNEFWIQEEEGGQ